MANDEGFYTLKGYRLNESDGLTTSMEDYLEMICRLLQENEVVRIRELAEHLHVKPSSASKMVTHLKDSGYIEFQKYGYIAITEQGRQTGAYLLRRHKILNDFLCLLNGSDAELEQVEKIEHFISQTTVENLEKLTKKLQDLQNAENTN